MRACYPMLRPKECATNHVDGSKIAEPANAEFHSMTEKRDGQSESHLPTSKSLNLTLLKADSIFETPSSSTTLHSSEGDIPKMSKFTPPSRLLGGNGEGLPIASDYRANLGPSHKARKPLN